MPQACTRLHLSPHNTPAQARQCQKWWIKLLQQLLNSINSLTAPQSFAAAAKRAEHATKHWTFCRDSDCPIHRSPHQNSNREIFNPICYWCQTKGHGYHSCSLKAEEERARNEIEEANRTSPATPESLTNSTPVYTASGTPENEIISISSTPEPDEAPHTPLRPTPPRRQLKTAQSVSKDASDTEPEEQDTPAPQQKSGKILRFYETTPTYDPHKTKPEFIQPNRPPYQFNIPYCYTEGPFTHDNLLTFNTRYLPNPELLRDSYTLSDTFNNPPEHNLKWEYWKKDTMEDLEEIAGPDYEKFPQLIGQFKQ